MGIIVIQNNESKTLSPAFNTTQNISDVTALAAGDQFAALNCTNNVIVSISELGYSTLTPGYFVTPTYPNFGSLQISIVGRPEPIITCDDVNKYLTVVIVDPIANQTCSTTFKVEDKLAPVFVCETTEVPCGIEIYSVQPPYTALVTVTDNCTNPPTVTILSHSERVYNCPSPYTFEIVRTYKATDASGNSSTCQDTVRFLRPVMDEIIFPNDTTISCEVFSSDTSVTGEPTWMGYPLRGVCFTWFGYEDKVIPMGCAGRFKIRRIWTVMDECNNTMRRDTQNIMAVDTTGPVVVCPDDQVVPLNSGACIATYVFQGVQATDACSPTVTFQYKVNGILVFTPSVNLPIGSHSIEVIANDGCNNTSNCTYNVLVEDQQAPSVTCHNINVGLGNNQTGIVCFDSLDFDYFDNCPGPLEISIRKSGDANWSDCVTYTCAEVGLVNYLQFQVCDQYGNCTVCEFEVNVQDLEAPVIDCGDEEDIELTCFEVPDLDPNDYLPTVTDNCGAPVITPEIFNDLDCNNEGIIIIKYTATDAAGNSASCSKRINVTNPNALDEGDIIWPEDLEMAGCNPNVNDTSVTGYPILLGEFCGTIDISSDLIDTTFNGEGCAVVVKQYTVIDSCVFDISGGTEGKYTHNQFITISGATAPVLTIPADVTIEPTDSASCTAFVDLPLAIADGCGEPILITNNYTNGGPNADGNYPLGVTQVIYTATNICGVITRDTLTVTVEYESNDLLVCPSPIELECYVDFDPENIPGPSIINVCGAYDVDTLITGDINICGTSAVTVTFSILTNDGRSDQCSYVINILGSDPIEESDIIWPESELTIDCELSLDPYVIGSFPVIENLGPCNINNITYEDVTADPTDLEACRAIERSWTVVDSCNYNEQTQEGVYTFTQIINVIDTLAPFLLGLEEGDTIFIPLELNDCKTRVNISFAAPTDCSEIDSIAYTNVLIPDPLENGELGFFPLGTHRVDYYISDICGNVTNSFLYLSIYDNYKPQWNCPDSLVITLPLNGLDTVHASDFSQRPFNAALDNCGYPLFTFDTLNYSDSLLYLACSSTPEALSMQDVQVWAYDSVGWVVGCVIDLIVLAPEGAPDCTHPMGILGKVHDELGRPISDAGMTAMGDVLYSSMTNQQGYYEIGDIPPGSDLMLSGNKNDNAIRGVNISDVLDIRDHILGRKYLNTPYKLLAGDVNKDDKLSVGDLIEIRKLILGKTDKYSSDLTWRFADKSYLFENKHNPFGQPRVFERSLQNVVGMIPVVDFVGLKLGDVNNTAMTELESVEIRNNQPVIFYTSVVEENAGEVKIKLSTEESAKMRGFQMDLNFDVQMLEFKNIETGNLEGFSENNYNVDKSDNGRLSFTWDDEKGNGGNEVVILTFKKLNSGSAAQSISIDRSRIDAVVSDDKGDERQIELIATGKWKGSELSAGKLLQNAPNPFSNKTSISVILTQATQGKITVYDVTGREIYTRKDAFEKGINVIDIKSKDLNGSGIYIYKFESDVFTDTKKMILTL